MKRYACAVIGLVLLVLGSGSVYGESQLICCGIDMPVVFEDPYLSDMAKEVILEDYRLIFGHLEASGRWSLRNNIEAKVDGRRFIISEGIMFLGDYKVEPDGFEEELMLIGVEQGTQSEYLFIPKHLSDAYKKAITLKMENPEIFTKLDEFIDFMNNLNEAEIAGLEDVVYLSAEVEAYRDLFEQLTVEEFKDEEDGYALYQYGKISLLETKRVMDSPQELIGKFVTRIVLLDVDNKYVDAPLLVFDDNKWKMFMSSYGT